MVRRAIPVDSRIISKGIVLGVAAYIFREIWVSHCPATYDNMKMSVKEICHKVMKRFQLLSLFIGSKILSQAMQYHIMDVIGINRHLIQVKRALWCKWEQSSPGLFKLNIGGLARDGQITGGGVVRDDNGEFIAGF